MKTLLKLMCVTTLLAVTCHPAQGQVGTEFTYQGQLADAGVPLGGAVDLVFVLMDAETGGTTIGSMQIDNVPLDAGRFTVQLDFGPGAFDGAKRWLRIEVRSPHDPTDNEPFTLLDPRQPLTATPYAMFALNATNGAAHTLDAAYDDGGPGSGRSITADSGPVDIGGPDGLTVGGPVGIGTTNPTKPLDVFGDFLMGGDGAQFEGGSEYIQIRGRSDEWHLGVTNTTSSTSTDFFISNSSSSTDGTFHIEQNGNVGIGTTVPAAKLQVAGTVHSTSGGFKFPDGTTQTTAAAGSASGNTLDQAYDEGGAGAGAVIFADNGPVLLLNGSDVNPVSGGYLQLGPTSGTNIGFDSNEIMARNNGVATTLALNPQGGTVTVGAGVEQGRLSVNTNTAVAEVTVDGDMHFLNSGRISYADNDNVELGELVGTTFTKSMRVSHSTGVGRVDVFGGNGISNVVLYNDISSLNHGRIEVRNAIGQQEAGMYVNSSGQGVVFGDVKNFRAKNPRDASTEIWYASLEGPEAAAYVRGTGRLVKGRAVVTLPKHFQDVATASGMTVQITPRSARSKGLAVVTQSLESFEVAELFEGAGDYEFHWEVKGVRQGFEDYKVYRPTLKSEPPAASSRD